MQPSFNHILASCMLCMSIIMDINRFLDQGITQIGKTAGRFYLKSRKGRQFMAHLIPALQKGSKKRKEMETKGVHIPPFLIASIASQCNLHCAGCYARAGGMCGSSEVKELTAGEWKKVFDEAVKLGINFILLAGGEPLMRKDIVELAAQYKDIVFPIFTNGTLVDPSYIELFDQNRNLIPVLSLEGDQAETDLRRGNGVYAQLKEMAERLDKRKILYGVSVTVTNQNMEEVTQPAFAAELNNAGCGVLFYIEYVPVENGTEELMLSDEDIARMDKRVKLLKDTMDRLIVLSFPGDEKFMGGCLAAGRGFFHINSAGGAEPCPFSPYSQLNVKTDSLLKVLQSDFFAQIREISRNGEENHQGGCTLFTYKDQVENVVG